jgi:hypothetical protein
MNPGVVLGRVKEAKTLAIVREVDLVRRRKVEREIARRSLLSATGFHRHQTLSATADYPQA